MAQQDVAPKNPAGENTSPGRVYLVIVDESPESARALRFAARRALRTGARVHMLVLVPCCCC